MRAQAARAVHAVAAHGNSATEAMGDAAASLTGPDRALLTELVHGTLRWHIRHRKILAALLSSPLKPRDRILESLMSVGIYQLTRTRMPEYAAVSSTVDAVDLIGRSRARGLVNAVLRRFQRESESLLADAMKDDEARYAYPGWLIEMIRADWPEDWSDILDSGNRRPAVCLRVNRNRSSVDTWLSEHADFDPDAKAIPGFEDAICLSGHPEVTTIPGFSEGIVSIQNAASQLAAPILSPSEGMRVLDACAAPGGKTGHLLETAPRAEVTAIDASADRVILIEENLTRLGVSADVICADAGATDGWWDGRQYDRILLDAPCSGTGVIRRHPDIKLLRRTGDIDAFAERQRALLDGVWSVLAPGGKLLYATCSILNAENGGVVAPFIRDKDDAVWLEHDKKNAAVAGSGTNVAEIRLKPDERPTDGFYYALIGRRS